MGHYWKVLQVQLMHHELTMKNYNNQVNLWTFLKHNLLDVRILLQCMPSGFRERERKSWVGARERGSERERKRGEHSCVCVYELRKLDSSEKGTDTFTF